MQIRVFLPGSISSGAEIFLVILIFLLTALPAAGQLVPENSGPIVHETLAPRHSIVWRATPIPLASTAPTFRFEGVPQAAFAFPDSTYSSPLILENQRLLSYAIIGAVIGGAVAYAGMPKSCDASENMFCKYELALIPVFGVGAGALAGTLVGYIREQR